jgi:GNAT superfamily N-acetyltransferase
LVALLLRLDQRSRISRFGSATNDAALVAHASQAVANAAWIAGAFIDARLCGIAELYEFGSCDPNGAEAAFVVEPCRRRRGIATALLRASVHWANTAGISTLRMVFSHSNWPMWKLARKGVIRSNLTLDDTICIELHVSNGVERSEHAEPMPSGRPAVGATESELFGTAWLHDSSANGAL